MSQDKLSVAIDAANGRLKFSDYWMDTNEFKEIIRNIINNSNEDAFWKLLYNNQIRMTDKEKELALLQFDKRKPIEITVVKYYPNSIMPVETPMGYAVFSEYPSRYCLIEQRVQSPNQGVVSLELGLIETEKGIYICGYKYVEKWTPDKTGIEFTLMAPKGLASQFKKTNGNWNWGTRLNGFDFRNFTFERFTSFLEDNLKIKIQNRIDIAGTYTFYAPIGRGNSISRTIVGLEKIGLKLTGH